VKNGGGSTIKGSGDIRAYVLIEVEPGMASSVVSNLRGRRAVALADEISGPYSAIAVVEGNSPSAVATAILMDMKKMSGVKDITVYLAVSKGEVAAHADRS
jgi:hypothetical protein